MLEKKARLQLEKALAAAAEIRKFRISDVAMVCLQKL